MGFAMFLIFFYSGCRHPGINGGIKITTIRNPHHCRNTIRALIEVKANGRMPFFIMFNYIRRNMEWFFFQLLKCDCPILINNCRLVREYNSAVIQIFRYNFHNTGRPYLQLHDTYYFLHIYAILIYSYLLIIYYARDICRYFFFHYSPTSNLYFGTVLSII